MSGAVRHAAGRRRFLLGVAGGAGLLLVGCEPLPADRIGPPEAFPGDGLSPPAFNAWIRIDDRGRVTVAVPRTEMGQGVSTALPMLVAETLDCAWDDVGYRLITPEPVHGNRTITLDGLPFRHDDDGLGASTVRWIVARFAGDGSAVTGGSTSTRDAWLPLQMAGAAARMALLQAAALRWQLSAADLRTREGEILAPDGRRLGYGALVATAAGMPLAEEIALPEEGSTRIVGRSLPRLDAPAKVNGAARFGTDVRLPGQRYAAVRMCPVSGGRLVSFDDRRARAMSGVQAVVASEPVFGGTAAVVVVADTTWTARRALDALDIRWDEGAHAAFDSQAYETRLRNALDDGEPVVWHETGDFDAATGSAGQRLDATYTVPLLAHAAIEPACATARYDTSGGQPRLTLWLPTQVPGLSRRFAAEAAGLPEDSVRVEQTLAGGGFGYKGLPDPVAQVVAAARALPDTPVQLTWSREDDLRHDLYRPPAVARASGWLDARGRPLAWRHRSASPSIVRSLAGRALPDWIARRLPDKTGIEGAFDNPYAIGAQRIEHVDVPCTAPLGFWRSVGHSHQAFFVESFIDEMAAAGGIDPLQYRLALLRDRPRHTRVLQAAASAAQWGRDRGARAALGLALHESFGSICAQAFEVSVDDRGRLRVDRVVCAVDCGRALNPGLVAQQMEGGVVFGLTAARFGRIDVQAGRVVQGNFPDYRLIDARSAPPVQTVIVPSDGPIGGIGEVAVPPVAPALCNAVFALTGTRLRALPIDDRLPFA